MMHLVLLLMMLSAGVSTTGCPTMCTCRIYPRDNFQKTSVYFVSVSCSAYVENVTSVLDNTTTDLQMMNLNQEELNYFLDDLVEDGTSLPYLSNLIIEKSEVENLNHSVEGLERIKSLKMASNHLENFPEVFLNLTNLYTLDLSGNDIKVLVFDPFRTLRILEVLNLSANFLTKIKSDGFSGLSNLKCLDLSKNKLTTIDDQALTALRSLQYLNLSNNRLEVLNEASFVGLIKLQQLDVSWNRLARVAPGSLQLPSLARLLLAGNPQLGGSREVGVLVGTGRKLQTVDASRTGLKQVPTALTHSIRTLRLAGNSIKTVSCGDLDSYPLLQLLDFTSNDLESVEEDALGRLDYLSVLYLTDNNIHEIPRSLPEQLKVLHLERNNIERVSAGDLQGLPGLEVLLLNDNKIKAIDETAFTQLVSLVTLDLSRNPVSALQPGCLEGPSALQVLRLSSIGIILPAEEVSFPLSTADHLIMLDLSDSPGLARQFLADTAALAASRELQELDLSRTGLQFIRSDLLHYLTQLRVLHVKENSLNCTKLEWLAAWMRRQSVTEYAEIVCASPPDLWGTPLVDLQNAEISPIETINQSDTDANGKAINIKVKDTINIYHSSDNSTRQYTTESTNTISFRNITNLIDNVTNAARNENNEGIDLRKSNSEVTNEIETLGLTKNKIYFSNKKNDVNIKSILGVEEQLLNKNEVLPERQEIGFERFSTKHSTKISLTHAVRDEIPITSLIGTSMIDHRIVNTSKSTVKKVLNQTETNLVREQAIDSDLTDNSWNVSTGEMSMYTNNKQESNFLHPGMLILAATAMGVAAAFAMLAARFTRRKRNSNLFRQEDIEVSSIPSVTELW